MSPVRFRFDLSIYPPGLRHPPHAHEELHISLVLRGRIGERIGDGTVQARALSAVVKDPGVTHADEFGPSGAVMARLVAPGRRFAELVPPRAGVPAWQWLHEPEAAAPFLRIVGRAAAGTASFAADDGDIVDLLAGLSFANPEPGRGVPPRWLRVAMEQLRDDESGTLTVREAARGAGVHPVYLARAVRHWYGTTPAAELRRVRLSRAAEAMAKGEGTASAVAHHTGFSDQPHLCRAFGASTGLTPGHYRRLVARIQGRAKRIA